jgi:transketolase N-terminal domain/subunit
VILVKGDAVTILWMVAFTNEESAMTFADAYGNALDKINGAHTAHRLARNGREVFVIVGDGAIRSHEFLPAIWKESTVTDAPAAR